MTSARFWRVLMWNLAATMRWWQLGATCLLYGFSGWQGANLAASAAGIANELVPLSIWDGLFVAFAGPAFTDGSLLNFLRWFVLHLLFFYLIGDLAYSELVQRGHTVVPAIGSRQRWWWGKLALLAVSAVSYVVLGVGSALIGASTILPWSGVWQGGIFALAGWNNEPLVPLDGSTLVFWIMVLFISTLFALAVWQTMLTLMFRRSIYGLLAMLGVSITSWLLGTNQPILARWLPGSQSMLLRHDLGNAQAPGFSWQWSVTYNVILAVIAIGIGSRYIETMDMFGTPLNERHHDAN